MSDSEDKTVLEDTAVSRAIKDMSPAKLSVKDVYERLCANRDREIELVWKRAVFLTAFLIACFTAYGGLLAAYIGSGPNPIAPFTAISVAAIGIGIVGMLLSVIWIQMTKGSKAWYEHYENVIECFVMKYSNGLLGVFASGEYRPLWRESIQKNYNLQRPSLNRINDCLCSTAGGCFSVSKIVVALGQLFFGIWVVIVFAHIVYLLGHLKDFEIQVGRFLGSSSFGQWFHPCWSIIVLAFIVLAFGLIVFLFVRGKFVKSRYLNGVVRSRKTHESKKSRPAFQKSE